MRSEPTAEDLQGAVALLQASDRTRSLAIVRAGLVISGIGAIATPLSYLFSHRLVTPIALGATSMTFVVWYAVWKTLLQRGVGGRLFVWANPIAAAAVPVVLVIVFAGGQGVVTALSAWWPPFILTAILATTVLRMRPWLPFVVSVFTSALYVLAYAFVVRPLAAPGDFEVGLFGWNGTIIRAASILVMGATFSAAVVAFRRYVEASIATLRSDAAFGRYRLGDEIAHGGMGSVVRATYCPAGGFERQAALKRIHPALANDPDLIARFRREASLGARLHHPNIVAVYDFGQVADTYFLAMEFIEGWTLLQLLDELHADRRRLTPELVALLAVEILNGLDYAHARARGGDGEPLHVVHRDLKPANVLVSWAGEVKLTDFGIASALRGAEAAPSVEIMGTLHYLAPEVIGGKPFDARADLYALGLIVWELLTGEQLKRRPTSKATLSAILDEDAPSVATVRPGLNRRWDAWFARALARDPNQRFATAREMKAGVLDVVGAAALPHSDQLAGLLAELRGDVSRDDEPAVSVGELPARKQRKQRQVERTLYLRPDETAAEAPPATSDAPEGRTSRLPTMEGTETDSSATDEGPSADATETATELAEPTDRS